MHLFTPCHDLFDGLMRVGHVYLIDSQWSAELSAQGHCQWSAAFIDQRPGINAVPDNTTRSILILRAGGYGDLLFMTPVLAELRRRFPALEITVATHVHTRDALHHPALADIKVIDYPAQLIDLPKYDIISSAELIASADMTYDASAYFAQTLGLITQEQLAATDIHPRQGPPIEFSLKPLYQVADEDRAQAWAAFPRHDGRARIGIQTESSVKNRTYPVDMTAQLIEQLIALDGCDVFTFGYPSPKAVSLPHFYPLQCLPEPPDFRTSCAILSTMDAVIAPDSSLCHVAGALDIPTVALFGPFHWRQRTSNMPSVRAIQGAARCAPCQWHLTNNQHYPPDKACSHFVGPIGQQRQRGCSALASIDPDRIRTTLWKWFHECTQKAEPHVARIE
jgi:ADP-heptose:LPS heptosyltransferase